MSDKPSDVARALDAILERLAERHGEDVAVEVTLSGLELWLAHFLVHNGSADLWQEIQKRVKIYCRRVIEQGGKRN
jgi:hypothetical protein